MEYFFKPSALRDLKKLSKTVQKKIIGKLDFYSRSNKHLAFAERLQDDALGSFRFRIGDYRVIFDVDLERKAIIILVVGHRKDIHR